jgi:ABC-2 type transport system permease protein
VAGDPPARRVRKRQNLWILLTHCAEGVRAAIVPDVPHLAPWISVLALVGFGLLFSLLGMIGFRRRSWA